MFTFKRVSLISGLYLNATQTYSDRSITILLKTKFVIFPSK